MSDEHEAAEADSGEPADDVADPEGSSGAEKGVSPWSPEAYDTDAEGPTTSTEDP
jgi:hypothetical protein